MKTIAELTVIPALALVLTSCSGYQANALTEAHQDARVAQVAGLFDKSSTRVEPTLVPCTLSGGTKTECFSITVTSLQTEHKTGPWCPRNISDGPDQSGIWLNEGKVYDADGAFVENLAAFYQDKQWQLFNPETGAVKVTDSKDACVAAARPDVDPKYRNYCVECLPSYVEDLKEITYLIPAHPVYLGNLQQVDFHSGIGLAFNGVKFDAPAPVEAILGSHTLAPFDDCGGHVNPHVGYHYHAVTGCTKEVASIGEHAASIGYAMDGFRIHSRLNANGSESNDLDPCGGHLFGDMGYHYHANDPGENQILGCFQAEQGCALEGDSQSCEMTGQRPPPPGMPAK
uniref:YHYH protein n=1 Tax=Marinobacterium profundum TaxID=1714300 RepID=UPI00082FF7CE|nr:YHYH protein [Marinobacterium profundum]